MTDGGDVADDEQPAAGRTPVFWASLLAFAALGFVYAPESIDDAYITLRFVRNLIEGHGLVFNPGEAVEGYSNPTWIAVLALLGSLGVPLPLAMKAAGFGCGVGTFFLVDTLATRLGASRRTADVAIALYGTSSFAAVWAVDGLETSFYTLLLTWQLLWLVTPPHHPAGPAAVAGLVAITRPEGPLFAALAGGVHLAMRDVRRFLWIAAGSLTAFGGLIAFRLATYGSWVSNPTLVKVHPGLGAIYGAAVYILGFLVDSGLVFVPLVLLGLATTFRWTRPRLAVAAYVVTQVAFVVVSGGDFMFAYRFVVPVMPALCLLAAFGLERLVPSAPTARQVATVAVVALVAVAQFVSLPSKTLRADNLTYRSATLFDIGAFLRDRTPPGQTILISEAGVMPWVSRARTVDYLGLVSDYRKVRGPGKRELRLDHLFRTHPKWVVLSFVEEDGTTRPRMWQDEAVLQSEAMQQHYEVRESFVVDRQRSFLDAVYYQATPNADRIVFRAYERVGTR